MTEDQRHVLSNLLVAESAVIFNNVIGNAYSILIPQDVVVSAIESEYESEIIASEDELERISDDVPDEPSEVQASTPPDIILSKAALPIYRQLNQLKLLINRQIVNVAKVGDVSNLKLNVGTDPEMNELLSKDEINVKDVARIMEMIQEDYKHIENILESRKSE